MTHAPRPAHRPRHALGAGPAPLPRHRAHGPCVGHSGSDAGGTPTGRRAVLAGAAAAVVTAGTAVGATPALALAGPVVHPTTAWGARPVRNTWTPGRPTGLVIHHMASPNTAASSLSHAFALARRCQADHMDRAGFDDSGQHFTVTRGGHCLEGRTGSLAALRAGDAYVKGAHVGGANTGRIGIECEGTYTSALPTGAQYRALVQLAAHLCRRYRIDPAAITGHRDHGATACPGEAFHAHLATLRRDVARTLASGVLSVSPLTGRPAPEAARPEAEAASLPVLGPGSRGAHVRRAQRLLTSAGHRVPATGTFADRTRAAVVAFQRAQGLVADGFVGPVTWGRLLPHG